MNSRSSIGSLHPEHFEQVCQILHRVSGISLRSGKEALVQSRLLKRLQALGLQSFEAYLDYLDQDTSGKELISMVDVLTTNKTSFFRESEHFNYLTTRILPEINRSGHPLRFWSAGCSSGAEPYSLAITICEAMQQHERRDIRILATDISPSILTVARQGAYEPEMLEGVPTPIMSTYFNLRNFGSTPIYQLVNEIKSMVRLARLNLMQSWPMRGPFDVIFCRNVMIYFDKSTQTQLAQRFASILRPGGYLFTGHSESLAAVSDALQYVQPAIYRRVP